MENERGAAILKSDENGMERIGKRDLSETLKGLAFIGLSFLIAFCMQVIVHELGHYAAGLLTGATGGEVFLHGFKNSKVVFDYTPAGSAQVIIGVMGIVVDVMIATLIGVLLWRQRSVLLLPLLMWGSVAYIGEGIGMLSSLAAYPQYIEDITQLLPLGVPAFLIAGAGAVMILVGLIWMTLIMPTAGICADEGFFRRLLAYLCCLPLYFALAILYIWVLSPMALDILEVRGYQLMVSLALALVLTVLHRPVTLLMRRLVKPKELTFPGIRDLGILFVWGTLLFGGLEIYSRLFN